MFKQLAMLAVPTVISLLTISPLAAEKKAKGQGKDKDEADITFNLVVSAGAS